MLDLNTMIICLDSMIEGFNYFYDKRSGCITEIDMRYVELADKYLSGDSLSEYSPWERDAVYETINFLKNYDNYVELPDRYEVDEYRLMARFCCTRKKKRYVNKLTDSLTGKGPIRKFKEAVRSLKLESEWIEFKENELINVAINWCNKNGIEFEEKDPV